VTTPEPAPASEAPRLTIRWLEVRWFDATVDRADLAEAFGGTIPDDLTGDPWDHGEDFVDFINGLLGSDRARADGTDGREVRSIEPAREPVPITAFLQGQGDRDQPARPGQLSDGTGHV
jgi:hypothetical protein